MQKTPVQRARAIEAFGGNSVAGGEAERTFGFSFLMFVILCGIALASPAPAPNPPVPSQTNVTAPLLQGALSFGAIDNSVPLWHSASFALFTVGAVEDNRRIELHHFDLPCESCHDPANATETDKLQGQSIWQMSADVNGACTSSCHEYNRILNHPVGVSVSAVAADEMPLDSSGQMTCLTCHYDDYSSAEIVEGDDDRMLLVPFGDELCARCHARMPQTGRGGSHWSFGDKAHLGSINPQSIREDEMARLDGEIDQESHTCLGCHEEVTVTVPGYNETSAEKAARWRKMKDHPIGMDYSRIAMETYTEYNYPPGNADRIRMFDGKVGCGSCHSVYSGIEKLLVVRNDRSFLCRQCHNR